MNPTVLLKKVYPTTEASKRASRKHRFDTETIVLLIISFILWILIIAACIKLHRLLSIESDVDKTELPNAKCTCLDVFDYGVRGSWIRSHDTPKEHSVVVTDNEIRERLHLPNKLHRDDMRCGLAFPLPNSTIPSACDAESDHACCSEHTGWCGSTSYHCNNPKSSNFKDYVPSNEAVWQQSSSECKVGLITQKAACDLLNLNHFNLIFMGDSEARKTLLALLLFLSGDFSHGVLERHIDSRKRRSCEGEMQLLCDDCKQYTRESSFVFEDEELCGFETSYLAEYYPDFNTFLTAATRKRIETLKNVENTYIILNSGTHFNANSKSFINYYLHPISDMLRGMDWPKLIVETLPRTPSVLLSDQRGAFSDDVKAFCKEHGITVFDNFQLSANLMPYDGKHFRLLFYLKKTQILLNFLTAQIQHCE